MKKRLKNIPFIILSMIVGGIVGASVGYFIDVGVPKFIDNLVGNIMNGIACVLILITGIMMVKFLNKAITFKQLIDKEDDGYEDKYDNKKEKYLYIASIFTHITNIIAFMNMTLLSLFAKELGPLFLSSLIPFFVAAIFSIFYSGKVHRVDERLPRLSDSNPFKTMLENVDEGEVHIMFGAIYKMYQFNVSAFTILVVAFAGLAAGGIHDLGIAALLMTLLYVANIYYYYAKVKTYYI
ncbi:DUF3169 family protein [Staphylococcus massiliensis]|uniref:DUF3169 family protein n=1 Tax=Staphylococcus massiliensis TaxID=555791 RepID=UPI001EDCF268|nr:DUF3169 family protein [Staphylococcus massiliensis]MCG3399146.1 DUF3169 family protein [Staphylococcus massiliensis]